MKLFCALVIFGVLLNNANCRNLVRKKRFFDYLWSSEVKKDVQNGLIYSQLPPEYIYLLPGVNDHKMLQRRADEQQQPSRFVHPTRMAILMQPQQQQKSNVQPPGNIKSQATNTPTQQQGPKIMMKPSIKFNPSITLKTKEQSLPDIHKNQRFVPLKPAQALTQPFNTQQQLPIKRSFETLPKLSIKTAAIEDFYFTSEFQDLLKEFNIKVDIAKLPPISEVMIILGTETAEETFDAIIEVTKSPEGMELIKSYLDQNSETSKDDEFYNYEEDTRAGEIQVSASDSAANFDNIQSTYRIPQNSYMLQPVASNTPPIRTTTTGTLTGQDNRSWWKPTTWFSSAPSTRVDSLKKDAEILKNIIPAPGTPGLNLNYIRNFLTPASRESIPIQLVGNTRRTFSQQPVIENSNVLPAVRMTEAQFQDMIKTLKLTPVNVQHTQQIQAAPLPSPVDLKPDSTKFHAPINVQSTSTGLSQQSLPLPTTYTRYDQPEPSQASLELPSENAEQENRRNFISSTHPQRATPFDFTATGRVHQANPEEVLKKSRSLAEAALEGESLQKNI